MVSVWDAIYISLNTYGQGLWALLPDYGSDTFDLAQRTIGSFIGVFVDILNMVLFFPLSMLSVFIDLLNVIIGSITGLINTVITAGNVVSSSFLGIFEGVFPSPWIAIFGTIIMINVVLRAYYFIKDIEILGNKV